MITDNHNRKYSVERRIIQIRKIPLYLLFLILFLPLVKLLLRPWIAQNEFPIVFTILVNSFPNFLEAIIGTMMITMILFVIRHRSGKYLQQHRDSTLIWIATLLAAIYVLTQEFKLHNFGGNNVYDPYDVIASIVGLLTIGWILMSVRIVIE